MKFQKTLMTAGIKWAGLCTNTVFLNFSPMGKKQKKQNRKMYDTIILCRRGNAFLYIFSIHRKVVSVIKRNSFSKSNERQNPTRLIPESAFALNYFINNALCKMEMFLFLFLKVLYFNESNLYVK